jgi:hypothetical protein
VKKTETEWCSDVKPVSDDKLGHFLFVGAPKTDDVLVRALPMTKLRARRMGQARVQRIDKTDSDVEAVNASLNEMLVRSRTTAIDHRYPVVVKLGAVSERWKVIERIHRDLIKQENDIAAVTPVMPVFVAHRMTQESFFRADEPEPERLFVAMLTRENLRALCEKGSWQLFHVRRTFERADAKTQWLIMGDLKDQGGNELLEHYFEIHPVGEGTPGTYQGEKVIRFPLPAIDSYLGIRSFFLRGGDFSPVEQRFEGDSSEVVRSGTGRTGPIRFGERYEKPIRRNLPLVYMPKENFSRAKINAPAVGYLKFVPNQERAGLHLLVEFAEDPLALEQPSALGKKLPWDLRVDESIRRVLGLEIGEFVDWELEKNEGLRFDSSRTGDRGRSEARAHHQSPGIFRHRFQISRVQEADPSHMDQDSCLMDSTSIQLLGLSDGDRVVVVGRNFRKVTLRVYSAGDKLTYRRKTAGGVADWPYPSVAGTLGIYPDIPWIFLDREARAKLGVDQSPLQPVVVRALTRSIWVAEGRDIVLSFAIGFVGVVFTAIATYAQVNTADPHVDHSEANVMLFLSSLGFGIGLLLTSTLFVHVRAQTKMGLPIFPFKLVASWWKNTFVYRVGQYADRVFRRFRGSRAR